MFIPPLSNIINVNRFKFTEKILISKWGIQFFSAPAPINQTISFRAACYSMFGLIISNFTCVFSAYRLWLWYLARSRNGIKITVIRCEGFRPRRSALSPQARTDWKQNNFNLGLRSCRSCVRMKETPHIHVVKCVLWKTRAVAPATSYTYIEGERERLPTFFLRQKRNTAGAVAATKASARCDHKSPWALRARRVRLA